MSLPWPTLTTEEWQEKLAAVKQRRESKTEKPAEPPSKPSKE